MKSRSYLTMGALSLLLCGCLEVEQHPGWRHGEYNGKKDNMAQQANFQGDRLAWWAAISNRNQKQNEFRRAKP
ncbi:hypothetical protein SAMN06265795_1329 [Noviherbaspirillum humi]|uniref:Lipoprotein n=1 Tax=Noviherbaspirillum humi TaxID=1688639 RepID=A0A239M7G1_9BURK|nr:hypothetical protein [Noviherbaspirillum humi]SNT37789.1 hypothetical protein SAMN06265795_1329 [Noviherbaspirillum humi]